MMLTNVCLQKDNRNESAALFKSVIVSLLQDCITLDSGFYFYGHSMNMSFISLMYSINSV